jgi:hypothetical protein
MKPSHQKSRDSSSLMPKGLLQELRQLIQSARQTVAQTVNTGLTLLYWRVGERIRTEILKKKRAQYGEEILQALAAKLVAEFGRGFSSRNLASMVRFAEVFPDFQIVQTLAAKLSWTHFVQIIPLDKPLQREFYAEMCRIEGWSTRTLREKIDGMLYERTAISRKPAKLIQQELASLRANDSLTPDLVFKDPYILDFLGLRDNYSEKDLEAALLQGDRTLSTGIRRRFCLCRTAEAHHNRQRGLLP